MRIALAGLLLATLLSGCGFQFAGSRPLPAVLDRVYVDVEVPYRVSEPPLETALRARLSQRGATVATRAEQAETQLRLWDLVERRETLSLGPDGKALEYRLVISVRYEVRRAGKLLLPADTLSASRDYSFQPNRILAKEAEEAQLREFLQGEMAELLLLRLEVGLREMPPEPANVVPLEPAPAPAG